MTISAWFWVIGRGVGCMCIATKILTCGKAKSRIPWVVEINMTWVASGPDSHQKRKDGEADTYIRVVWV